MMNTDDEKKKFLITLVNKMYSQGDNYFATKNKKKFLEDVEKPF